MNICVFCSSSEKIAGCYAESSEQLGKWIGLNGHTLIYGGAAKGLMEACAKSVSENKGYVISIIPHFVYSRDIVSQYSGQVFRVENLAQRKEMMQEYADVFVVLPGGIGTLDELFSALACCVVGEISKPIIILNQNGIYDNLQQQMIRMTQEGFIPKKPQFQAQFVDNVELCIKALSSIDSENQQ
ncbi:MAG: TIGR00730 family Rossman fold protein [Bacteroidia bacterium]|nr:TIGR00730 family Rossman fold protein [Bacteroidia bacterium]